MINWERQDHKYGPPSDIGKLGRWKVFSISWKMMSKDDKENPYGIYCFLPGLKEYLGECPTVEAAKQKAEKALAVWLEGAGL